MGTGATLVCTLIPCARPPGRQAGLSTCARTGEGIFSFSSPLALGQGLTYRTFL